jgi:RNA methyltransferase, TrmH family
MISKNELKYLKSLQLKKFRDQEKQFTVEGRKNVEEGINSSYKCTHIILTEKFVETNKDFLQTIRDKNIRYSITGEDEFNKAAGSVSPQGIMGVFDIPEKKSFDFNLAEGPVVYLDEISDPGNAGTIIRTCDWFGIKHIILSRNSAEIFNPKTVRSTAGSLFHLDIYPDTDLKDIHTELKANGFNIIVTVLDGESIYKTDIPVRTILVFSNEANGISKEVLQLADKKIFIPGKGKAESLNVASAAAVVIAEAVRSL